MPVSEVFSLLSIFIVVAVQTLAVIRYLLNVISTNNKETTKKLDDGDAYLHKRINDVRDTYVKRSELDRDLDAITKTLTLMREDMKQGIALIQEQQAKHSMEINKRFDMIAGNLIMAAKKDSQ